jgi:hypothetical protein
MRAVFYTKKHSKIVESGIQAISEVLNGKDISEKESLLLCLDKYLDPYFGYNLTYQKEIEVLLQNVIFSENPIIVKEDTLQLVTSYCWPPFPILEDGIDKIDPKLLPDVKYAINVDNEE